MRPGAHNFISPPTHGSMEAKSPVLCYIYHTNPMVLQLTIP